MALVLESGAGFILTSASVILCPHGGMVMHVPSGGARELINGVPIMLLNDFYPVAGCPNSVGGAYSPCIRVMWVTASTSRLVNGIPVLIHTSTGLCLGASGTTQGAPIVASFQTVVKD
jgi:hypothetical protein